MTSRYKITRRKYGFDISGKERETVRVRLNNQLNGIVINPDETGKISIRCNLSTLKLHSFYKMRDTIVAALWGRYQFIAKQGVGKGQYALQKMKTWAKGKTKRAITKRLHNEWKYLLSKIDPLIVQVDKRLFACTFRKELSDLLLLETNIYKEKYLIKDILNYNAAAYAVEFMSDLVDYNYGDSHYLRHYGDWKRLFAPGGIPYRSLNRTLMNLPRCLSSYPLTMLKNIRLMRPLTNRAEFLTTVLGVYRCEEPVGLFFDEEPTIQRENAHVFHHATLPQIKVVAKRLGDHLRTKFSPYRTNDISTIVNYLCDYPDVHNGNIVGLTSKSIKWHRETHFNRLQRTFKELSPDTATAKPPINVPNTPEITFLASVQEIYEESTRMNNCISSYAKNAVNGVCYLFHIEYNGEHATIEVSPKGHVQQSYGPNNSINQASQWGKRKLAVWAKLLVSKLLRSA